MKSDNVIKQEGMNALVEKLGIVDMERFIALINHEKFDYTKWRKNLFEDMSLTELADKADKYSKGISNE